MCLKGFDYHRLLVNGLYYEIVNTTEGILAFKWPTRQP